MADEIKTPPAPEAKPVGASPAPAPTKVSFRIFAHGLDAPLAAALRVHVGLAPNDVDREFTQAELQAALADLTKEA